MRFSLSSDLCALSLSLLVACSGNTPSPASGTGGSAGSSSGGRSAGSGGSTVGSSGGSTSTGTGGFDPSAARECGIDAGVNACRGCLAVKCCAAAQACFADPKCAAAFEPYQACVKSTPDDISRCYSDFTRTVLGDAHAHQALLTCIAIGGCNACGAPGAL
jgi:hypothetical protein